MTKSKGYWLATAALLIGGIDAQAADLPFRKAAPVEYVRICNAFGAGFFYIPGTDTCLRIAGQLRAEETFRIDAPTSNPNAFAYNQAGQTYRRDLTNFRARGYANLDSRTETAYGTLRAFVSVRITDDTTNSGPLGGRGQLGVAGVPTGVRASTGIFQGLPAGQAAVVDKAFIQFAGVTAGRTSSFFDFDAQSVELINNTVANSTESTMLLAYTATFGGGFSATVSAEDAEQRRTGDNGTFVYSPTNIIPVGPAPVLSNNNNPLLTGRDGVLAYGGEGIPDFVANLRYDAAWGSAQLSGAYHSLTSVPVTVLTSATVVGANPTFTPSADGFAVLGGVKVLLPFLTKADSFTIQGTYSSGAMDYANSNNYFNGLSNIFDNNASQGVPVNDAFVNNKGKIEKAEAYGGYANFRHYWIPDVSSSVFGAYLQINNPVAAQTISSSTDNARIYQVGLNTIWTPVKDFQIGAEGLYSNMKLSGAFVFPAKISGSAIANPDDFRARLSLRRAF